MRETAMAIMVVGEGILVDGGGKLGGKRRERECDYIG